MAALLMVIVLGLAASIWLAGPVRARARLLIRGEGDSSPTGPARRAPDDGLHDTAMMLELVASMLDAGCWYWAVT